MLDVGSRDVNGSARSILTPYLFNEIEYTDPVYVGVDIEAGPGVDVVASVEDLATVSLARPRFDIVVSTEMLEHVKDWREAVWQMGLRVKVGGLMIITTRSPGFEYHPYPEDNWRFTVEHMKMIFGFGWKPLAIETDPDPGQRGVAPFGYFGVGVAARREMDSQRQVTGWYEWLSTIEVMKP